MRHTDETKEFLKSIENKISVISNKTNTGFVEACNQAADIATGDYLLFLNNDTEPQANWLDPLVSVLENDDSIGAVGSQLLYPDGTLQEAGGVIFRDGSVCNFGDGDSSEKPIYNRMIEVDYCTGACFMVRRSLFQIMGGFDDRYAPAYYEETDLCFSLRKSGYKVIYVPESQVVHHKSITAGKNEKTGFRKYLKINRGKFTKKWKNELQNHEPPLKPGGIIYTSDRQFLR